MILNYLNPQHFGETQEELKRLSDSTGYNLRELAEEYLKSHPDSEHAPLLGDRLLPALEQGVQMQLDEYMMILSRRQGIPDRVRLFARGL